MFLFIRMKRVYAFIGIIIIASTIYIATVKRTIPVTAIPLDEPTYTIVIDAGHGEPDGGAISKSGIKESDINLYVAKDLELALDSLGYSVIMTRQDENNIADSDKQDTIRKMKVSDLANRVKIVNESGADLCISIHMNKFASEKYYGWQTFYNKNSEYNKILAEKIQNGISNNIDRENNRVALSIKDIKLTDESKIPTAIVECGFLSNPEDLRLLQTEEYRNKLVNGIIEGIENYYDDVYSSGNF